MKLKLSGTDGTLSEIQEYVDRVDERFQEGRYDDFGKKDRQWIIDQIIALREQLKVADPNLPPSEELQASANALSLKVASLEEGGIVCKRESRVGSRMSETKCRSQKRAAEDSRKAQDELRRFNRQRLPNR